MRGYDIRYSQKIKNSPDSLQLEEAYQQARGLLSSIQTLQPEKYHKISSYEMGIYNDIVKKMNTQLGHRCDELSDRYGFGISYEAFLPLLNNCVAVLTPYMKVKKSQDSLIQKTEIEMLPKILFDRVVEADKCYTEKLYTACCVLCGTVMESMIIEKIGKQGSWDDNIKAFCKKYNLKHEEDLVNQMKEWRDSSAHVTTLVFDEARASIFLKTLIMVAKEVYKI